jgi:prepilin-type N-terminal cleavage/methylation domain-containing protein
VSPRCGARRRGFTLLEVVLSLAVASLLLVLAAQLLRSAHLVFLDSAREALDPEPRLAAAWIRRDVREALGVAAGAEVDSEPSLLLSMPDSSVVRYERNGPRFVRVRLDAAGNEVNRRALLAPLLAWSWSEPQPGLVAVSLATAEHVPGRSLESSAPERLLGRERRIETDLLVARRLGRAGW